MVSFHGFVVELVNQSLAPDEIWLMIGDENKEVMCKFVAPAGFNRSLLIESIGKTILLKHVYVLNATSVFYDEGSSIASSFEVSPANSEHLLVAFKAA
jgi:hypothetical protein